VCSNSCIDVHRIGPARSRWHCYCSRRGSMQYGRSNDIDRLRVKVRYELQIMGRQFVKELVLSAAARCVAQSTRMNPEIASKVGAVSCWRIRRPAARLG
jgi:hypothetical protein